VLSIGSPWIESSRVGSARPSCRTWIVPSPEMNRPRIRYDRRAIAHPTVDVDPHVVHAATWSRTSSTSWRSRSKTARPFTSRISHSRRPSRRPATFIPKGFSAIKARSTWMPSPPSTTRSGATRSIASSKSRSVHSISSGRRIMTSRLSSPARSESMTAMKTSRCSSSFCPRRPAMSRNQSGTTVSRSRKNATAGCSPGSSFRRPSRSRAGCSASAQTPSSSSPNSSGWRTPGSWSN
jgi:hypothetical protein